MEIIKPPFCCYKNDVENVLLYSKWTLDFFYFFILLFVFFFFVTDLNGMALWTSRAYRQIAGWIFRCTTHQCLIAWLLCLAHGNWYECMKKAAHLLVSHWPVCQTNGVTADACDWSMPRGCFINVKYVKRYILGLMVQARPVSMALVCMLSNGTCAAEVCRVVFPWHARTYTYTHRPV